MNYLTYPLKKISITQSYDGSYSHSGNYTGNPQDFPFDDNGASTAKDNYFYCPCDSMIVKRIYGVNTSGTNTIWLESTSKVKTPTFEDYVTILIMHPEDIDLQNIKVNQIFTRGEKVTIEGKDGNATGYHFHLSVGKGKFVGNGWTKNSKGSWVINTTEYAVKPEEAFYIDESFTSIINTKGIVFEKLPTSIVKNIAYVTAFSLNVRKGPGLNYEKFNTLPEKTQVTIEKTVNNWHEIASGQWISGDYVTQTKPESYYITKEVNATWLNVRKTENGTVLSTNAPLPKGTLVAVMEETDYWTKINTNRWVYTYYLK